MHLRTLGLLLALFAALGPRTRAPAAEWVPTEGSAVTSAYTPPLPFLASSAAVQIVAVERSDGAGTHNFCRLRTHRSMPALPPSQLACTVARPGPARGTGWIGYAVRAHHIGTPPPAFSTRAG